MLSPLCQLPQGSKPASGGVCGRAEAFMRERLPSGQFTDLRVRKKGCEVTRVLLGFSARCGNRQNHRMFVFTASACLDKCGQQRCSLTVDQHKISVRACSPDGASERFGFGCSFEIPVKTHQTIVEPRTSASLRGGVMDGALAARRALPYRARS